MKADSPVTWLFVPGNVPARFDKASRSGADAVVLDLEDAVRPTEKGEARANVLAWLMSGGSAWVRVNASDTIWHEDDLRAIRGASGLLGIMLPKAEDPADIVAASEVLEGGTEIVALIESAVGIHRAHEIAGIDQVCRLAFGSLDFALDVRADHVDDAFILARCTLVLASKVAGLPAPIDGVTAEVGNDSVVTTAARHAKSLGLGAKLCIHPSQLVPVSRAFAFSAEEIAWATAVLDTAEGSPGAVTGSDGSMIDKPVIDRARTILAGSDRTSPRPPRPDDS